jgi:hypothetical protein
MIIEYGTLYPSATLFRAQSRNRPVPARSRWMKPDPIGNSVAAGPVVSNS